MKFPNKREEQSPSKTRSMEETTMKRLTDLETALWEAIGKVDRTKLAIKKLENENAEIRADIEAYKLIVSENKRIKLEVLKREKKCLRKLGVWEKQKKKLQDAIAAEMQNISDLQQQLVELEAAIKEAEAKWKQERRAREQAFALVKAELRRNEEAKATNKRTLEGMRLRFKIDSQRHKDDLQWLHQELSQLKASVSNELLEGDAARVLRDFERLEVSSAKNANSNQMCVICRKGEVSVVLLPCAHQALCTNCNDYYGKNGRAKCPCCGVPIERRIQVFV